MTTIVTETMLATIVERIQALTPSLHTIIVCGSYARDEADQYSDVDLVALTRDAPSHDEATWFEVDADGQLRHISVDIQSDTEFTAGDHKAIHDIPAPWGAGPAIYRLGFAVRDAMRVIWRTADSPMRLHDDVSEVLPAAPGELEDFVEFFRKTQRAALMNDRVALRVAARNLAETGVGLVRDFNAPTVVHSTAEALHTVLAFTSTPSHFHEDFAVCWGLQPADDAAVATAATRLVDATLAWLRERLEGQHYPQHDVRFWLLDGTLEKYVRDRRGVT